MQRSSRSIKGDAGLTRKLVEEAAAMEARLAELKLSMIQERAKREAMAAASTTGSIWNNGAAGLLRSKGMQGTSSPQLSKQTASSTYAPKATKELTGGDATVSSGHRQSSAEMATTPPHVAAPVPLFNPTPPSAKRPTAGAADRIFSREHSRTGSSRSSKPEILICSEHRQTGSVRGGEATSSLLDGAYNGAASHAMFQQTISNWRAAGFASSSTSDDADTSSCNAKAILERTGAGSLLHGTYDEAANRDSFQQALKDWRAASSTSSNSRSRQAGQAVDTAANTCQTEARQLAAAAGSLPTGAGSRGTSAAGSICTTGCSGSYLLKMLASNRSNSMNARSAGTATASTSSGDSGVSNAHEDSTDQLQGCQQDQQVLQECSTGHSAACLAKNSSSGCSAATEPADERQATQEAQSQPDAAQPVCALNDWMASLQETEQAAAQLATVPTGEATSFAGSSTGHDEAAVIPSTAVQLVTAAPAAKLPGAKEYQQQLQQVLSELEQLEQLQAAQVKPPCTSQPLTAAAFFSDVFDDVSTAVDTAHVVGMRLPDAIELPNY